MISDDAAREAAGRLAMSGLADQMPIEIVGPVVDLVLAAALPLLRKQWEADALREFADHCLAEANALVPPNPMYGYWRHAECEAREWAAALEPMGTTPADGDTREQWAVRNLRSGGSIVRWSEADAREDLARASQRDPYGPDPDPHDLAHRWWTEYADGSVAGTPWTVVDDGAGPTTEGQERSEGEPHVR